MKNIPVESVNYENLGTCFDVPRKKPRDEKTNCQYQKCYLLLCVVRIVSYPGITRIVHIRLKWLVDRYIEGLEYMTAVWMEREDSHSVCNSLMPLWTSVNCGC